MQKKYISKLKIRRTKFDTKLSAIANTSFAMWSQIRTKPYSVRHVQSAGHHAALLHRMYPPLTYAHIGTLEYLIPNAAATAATSTSTSTATSAVCQKNFELTTPKHTTSNKQSTQIKNKNTKSQLHKAKAQTKLRNKTAKSERAGAGAGAARNQAQSAPLAHAREHFLFVQQA